MRIIRWVVQSTDDMISTSVRTLFLNHDRCRRPFLDVNMEEVRDLHTLGFKWTQIAKMLKVSRQTLYRRLANTDLLGYTDISDQELDCMIQEYKETHPNDGESMIIGYLRACQVFVPRSRIRGSIHRVDSAGVEERRRTTIRRRVYEVEAPNSVWHVDGNHKLIRWKYVIHGAVDGFSRVIPFLHCSTNNTAETVYYLFLSAVSLLGLPERVRTDGGGENVDVWEYMVQQHRDVNSVIVGSSVHNVRIERLWRDVRRGVIDIYRETFSRLEEERILNPDNDVDIYCLHEVFTNRINKSLSEFVSSWHNHSLSSERSLTPLQLFYAMAREQQEHASDETNSSTTPTVVDHVQIPTVRYIPCSRLKSRVEQAVHDNQERDGSDVYRQVCNIVGHHITLMCNSCRYE